MTNNTQPPVDSNDERLTIGEAVDITHQDDRAGLNAFVAALGMQKPVTTDQAAFLLEHMIKEQMTADTTWIAGQMRVDHWDKNLAAGESVEAVADRAFAFLNTPEGAKLFNFFVKTFAKTSGQMFP